MSDLQILRMNTLGGMNECVRELGNEGYISMSILDHERIKVKNQIFELNRKVTLLEKFMSDYPNAKVEKAQAFIAYIDHTDFTYEEILDNMGR